VEYWGLRNYGEATETVWDGEENCSHEWKIDIKKGTTGGICKLKGAGRAMTEARYTPDSEHAFCVKCGAWKGQLGLEPTWQMYVEHMVTVCRELKRVLKRTGSMYIVLGDTYAGSHCGKGDKTLFQNYRRLKVADNLYGKPSPQADITDYQPKCLMGIPWRTAFALIDDGWVLRERIVWHKGNPMPGSQKDRLTQTCETIFHFVRNSGKALLWRNELTGEWLSLRPNQVYFHVETHELRQQRPPKEERYVVDEFGSRHLVWKPLWRGFDYYYELDAIREPHTTANEIFTGKTKPFGKKGSPGYRNAPVEESYGFKFNLRVRDVKRGKKGLYVEDGKVKELKASEKEVESYVYPESLTKHDVAVRRFPTVNRQGGLGYTDPLHVKAYHEKGKNPGDTFQTKKEPYIGNNPHRMRLQKEQHLALDPSRPMDLSHPKGKNPGDVLLYDSKYAKHEYGQTLQAFVREQTIAKRRLGSREEAKQLFPNDPKKQQEYINYIHDHDGHPKGKNLGDVLKLDSVACPSGPQRWEREGTNRVDARFHAEGKNPGDFWVVCTKPFKGAHFAVYPEEICVKPILSSCPPNGVVLDPMCGSGTTLVVAKKLGRSYIGIDINVNYVEMAKNRLSKIPEKLDKFVMAE